MKKQNIKYIALLLAIVMLFGSMVACDGSEDDTMSETVDTVETEVSSGSETEKASDSETDPNSETDPDSEIESESESDLESETTVSFTGLGIENAQMIEYADYLADNVDAYYKDSVRSATVIENMNMRLIHGLTGGIENPTVKNLVNSIENKNGGIYVSDTMDAFVKTTDGEVYYASDWMTGSSLNIYRAGYYYQEVRITDQGFANTDALMKNALDIDLNDFVSTDSHHITNHGVGEDGILSFTVDNCADPGIQNNKVAINTKEYNALLLTIKTEHSYNAQVFIKIGSTGYSSALSKHIGITPGDDYHTYIIRLDDIPGFKGKISGIRFDMARYEGELIQIKSLKAVNINENTVPVRFDRGLHAYSDKLNQELHFVTTAATDKVASYGMVTNIDAATVNKLVVKDANGIHSDLDGVDWNSAEYVGFDIKNVGIFGYILADHEGSGKLTVSLDGDNYVITQEKALADGSELAKGTNFYMGHRIYTDASHSFNSFLKEANIERNPLDDKYFSVGYDKNDPTMYSKYVGYDALRGAYRISINSSGFNPPYYEKQNIHYRAYTTVKGDDLDRKIYLYTAGTAGGLECAAVLNENDLMLPIPLQVIKNFGGDGEESIFLHDTSYCEVYMPLMVDANSSQTFSILNLYQNWGNFPLKQISWIQYYAPYYHLSTGVTETNCIAPMYGVNAFQQVNDVDNGVIYEFYVTSGKTLYTLPDFRAMSALLWTDQPQHNSCASISWLEYYTADGGHYGSDFISDKIDAAGPTYADITMDYISDDGKISATYRHAEMPQTDENRTYYSLRYDVNDTVEIANFMEDFNIIEVNSRFQTYENIGYLNENNECVIESANKSADSRFIKLGDEYPYFALFTTLNNENNRATNYAVIIKGWDIVLGGEKYEGSFILEEWFRNSFNYSRLSLDIGKITLQKGDYIDIDLILLPWGKADAKDDSNVRQVRQDSCIDPYKVTASVGEVIEDAYIPKLMAENNTAEFTLSGGHNNGVVRIYGFDKLTSPKVSELVGGEWITYELSSANTPDDAGITHYYDGYCVHYDEDGTFSYSFVFASENGAERTFRIAVEDFEPYPEIETGDFSVEEETEDEDVVLEEETKPTGEGAPALYYSAQDLYVISNETLIKGSGSVKLTDADLETDSEGIKYARLYAEAGTSEAFVVIHGSGEIIKSAPYMAIKYKTNTAGAHEIWLNSFSGSPEGSFRVTCKNDEKWQYYVIDTASTSIKDIYTGERLAYFRFDFLNVSGEIALGAYMDVAFVGFFETEGDAMRFEFGENYKTAEEIKNENNALCVDPSSGYHVSEIVYGANIDKVNGMTDNVSDSFAGRGGDSKQGVDIINYNDKTLDNGGVVIAGWSIADGGIEKYIWSADGGKTWYQTGVYTIANVGSGAGTAHHNVVCKSIGSHSFSKGTEKNSTYQFNDGIGGIMINLSAFSGQTIDVIWAAVPTKDTHGLCLLALFKGIEVVGGSEAPEADKMLPEYTEIEDTRTPEEIKADNNAGCIDPSSGYKESSLIYGCSLDMINGMGENGEKNFGGRGGNSATGVDSFYYGVSTVKGSYLVFTGWTVVDGGIEKYVWSADGGKTWNEVEGYNNKGPENGAGTAHYNVIKTKIGDHSFSEGSPINSTYGGAAGAGENVSGLAANLKDYAGKTVEVIFAAVPIKEPGTLCLIARVANVTVAN